VVFFNPGCQRFAVFLKKPCEYISFDASRLFDHPVEIPKDQFCIAEDF